jgi:DNA-binding response OmpR family regulator
MPLILVVDDEPTIRALLREALESNGHRVLEAEDGAVGLEMALREQPDLVLLDIRLPKLSGLDVCRWLRRNAATASTPVLLITGLATENERQAGAQAGATGLVTKPFSPADIVSRVDDAIATAVDR